MEKGFDRGKNRISQFFVESPHFFSWVSRFSFTRAWQVCEKQNVNRKKPRGTLRQSEVFFPLADHAIVAHHVVPPGICPGLIQNHPAIVSSSFPIKCGGRRSTLFASPFWFLRNIALPITN